MVRDDSDIRVECASDGGCNQALALLDVRFIEKELAVKVGQVNRVEIDDLDVAEAGDNEVLEYLAANSSSPNDEDPSRLYAFEEGWSQDLACERISRKIFGRRVRHSDVFHDD